MRSGLKIGIFNETNLPEKIAFDHRSISSGCPFLISVIAQGLLPERVIPKIYPSL